MYFSARLKLPYRATLFCIGIFSQRSHKFYKSVKKEAKVSSPTYSGYFLNFLVLNTSCLGAGWRVGEAGALTPVIHAGLGHKGRGGQTHPGCHQQGFSSTGLNMNTGWSQADSRSTGTSGHCRAGSQRPGWPGTPWLSPPGVQLYPPKD